MTPPSSSSDHRWPPIEHHAFLADCRTTALVGPDGALDWMCAPRFDDGAVFARLLDRDTGGSWEMTVADADVTEAAYLGDTLIAQRRWTGPHGTVLVHDFLALQPPERAGERGIVAVGVLVRMARCVSGTATVRHRVDARPDFAARATRWRPAGEKLRAEGGTLQLSGDPTPTLGHDGVPLLETHLSEGQSCVLALHYASDVDEPDPRNPDARTPDTGAAYRAGHLDSAEVEALLRSTRTAWQAWSDRTDYNGPGAALVRRSSLVLRGLQSDENGGVIAAATCSLPEWPGGQRNWDYRYVWHRDAALVVLVLMRLGHQAEAGRYIRFVLSHCTGETDALPPLARANPGPRPDEEHVDRLAGYRASHPVRWGNDAFNQHQFDAYGHVVDAAYVFHEVTEGLSADERTLVSALVDTLSRRWREPDDGIWEARGPVGPRHWTHSKLLAWVGLDRGIRLAERCGDAPAELEHWRSQREAVRQELLERGVSPQTGAFVQSYGATHTDAALLQVPMLGLLRGDDPRVLATLDRIQRELGEGDHLIHRYDPEQTRDGLDEPEGAFLMCSFDMVSALVLAGRTEEASRRFDALCARAGPFGLFAEEMMGDGTHLGNYPQAFTHLALVSAAMNLSSAGRVDELHAWADRRAAGRADNASRPT